MDQVEVEETQEEHDREEAEIEGRASDQRLGSVLAVLRSAGATSVVDLGCGDGRLVRAILEMIQLTERTPFVPEVPTTPASARAFRAAWASPTDVGGSGLCRSRKNSVLFHASHRT